MTAEACSRRRTLRLGAVRCRARLGAVAAGLLSVATVVAAAGAPPSSDLPDLAKVRVLVYAGDYPQAVARLSALTRRVQHAEVYNLLGYSLRQLRRYDEAAQWYRQALLYDPEHRPALAYQGELFIALGDLPAAAQNLRYLQILCGEAGCAEHRELQQALAVAQRAASAASAP